MAHALWRAVLRQGDTAIDATMGNGWDTMILAKLVLCGEDPSSGSGGDNNNGDDDGNVDDDEAAGTGTGTTGTERRRGRVVAFDIQQGALDSTRVKMEQELTPEQAERCHLVLGSHDTLEQHVNVAVEGEDADADADADSRATDDDDDDDDDADADAVGVVCFNLGYLPGPVGTGPTTS